MASRWPHSQSVPGRNGRGQTPQQDLYDITQQKASLPCAVPPSQPTLSPLPGAGAGDLLMLATKSGVQPFGCCGLGH